jgi:lysophospholipase L1-like esterase
MSTDEKYLKPEYTFDGLHLTKEGYVKWQQLIKKFVN